MTAVAEAPAPPAAPRLVVETPGVYEMDEAAYHADPVPAELGGSLSCSGAKWLLPPYVPAHFAYQRKHPRPPTASMELGTAAHKLALGSGPELVLIDADEWRTADIKRRAQEARERGAIPLKPKYYRTVQDMAAALLTHPDAAPMLAASYGRPEQSVFWQDGHTGAWLRSRLDVWPYAPADPDQLVVIPDFKGLALDTPIPTPSGWTTMGALRVGDRVLDSAGQPCRVTGKSAVHLRRCYRIRFDDGSSVVCDDEHLWVTTTGRGGRQYRQQTTVHTTEEIRRTLKLCGQCHHRVAVAQALTLPPVDLPIDPYVLGCWIGDGSTGAGRITSADDEIFQLIEAAGYRCSAPAERDGKCPTRTIYGLQTQLRKAGLLGHKAIPDRYLRSAEHQRVALLHGLMDTDGSWNTTRQQAVFTTTIKAIAVSVKELACSLGQRAIIHQFTARGFGLVRTAYRVTFTPIQGLNPFRLARKANQVTPTRPQTRSQWRIVMAVEDIPAVATQCITVDSPDCTYLCTESMIPTHNTADSADEESFARAAYNYGYFRQAPWYVAAWQAMNPQHRQVAFVFIVQEKTEPYLVRIVQLDPPSIRRGQEENRRAINRFAECTRTGVWPGYQQFDTIALPGWAARRLDGGI